MSIDYDRLRAELDRHENGDDHDNYKADEWLYMNKGKIARELLRLRDELTDLRDTMYAHAELLRGESRPVAADYAHRLNRILNGDNQ